jgi:hypothetical protein
VKLLVCPYIAKGCRAQHVRMCDLKKEVSHARALTTYFTLDDTHGG